MSEYNKRYLVQLSVKLDNFFLNMWDVVEEFKTFITDANNSRCENEQNRKGQQPFDSSVTY